MPRWHDGHFFSPALPDPGEIDGEDTDRPALTNFNKQEWQSSRHSLSFFFFFFSCELFITNSTFQSSSKRMKKNKLKKMRNKMKKQERKNKKKKEENHRILELQPS
jgi:hypothetical protein